MSTKREYSFTAVAPVTFRTTVRADCLQDAITEALSRNTQSLCPECRAKDSSVQWVNTDSLTISPDELEIVHATCAGTNITEHVREIVAEQY